MVVVETKKVLKPFVNDFLFRPTRMDADKIPVPINPNNIKSPATVKTMPTPTQTSMKIKAKSAKMARPGAKLS